MADRKTGANAPEREAVSAFAATLAPDSTTLTLRPDETGARPRVAVKLPASALIVTNIASTEDTAVVYERLLRAQSAEPEDGAAESYEVIASIGKGGMGEVFKAVQRSLGREVAIKQLATDNPAAVDYFLSEARITARLAHANIIPVHALGRAADGRPLIAMKLVHGPSWQDLLRREPAPEQGQAQGQEQGPPLDLVAHLRIFVSVCNAVAFAHAEGFLHRDLKPANVMVASYGQVFVLDWGLAVGLDREVCDEHGILHVEDVRSPAGTPAYMPPELALGDGRAQGVHTDVYLLGACLHEVATGGPPHAGADTALALQHAVASEPPEYGDGVPRELAEICRRALARAPADRYPSVTALREAVEAFVTHSAARAVTEKGLRALARLTERTSAYRLAPEPEKLERARAIHRSYSEARFAFELALESWAEDVDAKHGLENAARTMLEHALEADDLALSTRLAAEVDDPGLKAQVEALRARAAAREAELAALREQAEMLDDTKVAGPLGTVFLAAGLVGGAAIFPTRIFLARGDGAATVPTAVLWTAITLFTGLYAVIVLRRGARKSLVSPRVAWTWAAVGVGCLSAGAVAIGQGETPFANASYTTMMIAIGFVAMALQTRLWLLFPAITTFFGAIFMGFFPARRIEIFGLLWFVTLTGVGLALRRGARFDGRETVPPSRVR
jgi:serine/threonine protein kinase